eukprot:4463768-Pyramimonas_sp.AAC.2
MGPGRTTMPPSSLHHKTAETTSRACASSPAAVASLATRAWHATSRPASRPASSAGLRTATRRSRATSCSMARASYFNT